MLLRHYKIFFFLSLLVILSQLTACSTYDTVRVVTSRDPGRALEQTAKNRVESYKHNPFVLAKDVRRLINTLKGNVDREWGKRNRQLPSPHRFVKYTQNYKSRAIIDFDSGKIRIETVATKRPLQSLHNAIVTTLLTPNDPRSVDLYTDHVVELKGRPYLAGFVRNQHGRYINNPEHASRYADYLNKYKLKHRTIAVGNKKQLSYYVNFNMVSDHADIRARRYAKLVSRYAKRFQLNRSLVYAIIQTESNFNPFAISAAPAYGLMQLVPTSGGRDAYRFVKGRDQIPSRQYLFNAQNNIELGTGYLNVINTRYFKNIRHPLSREYCTIAAYNTGSGNVLRAFHSNRTRATRIINGMSPAEVYKHLRKKLKYHEARRYLLKVTEAQRQFVRL